MPHSSSLLFSLQFYIDHVSLPPVTSSLSLVKSLLLAFQLLQYEIVVFDASLTSDELTKAGDVVTSVRHGKSCLFEADPNELALELQQEAEVPLALLLLAKEHGRARLLSFAGVTLSLHVGLLYAGINRLNRICEWASESGSWELRDHHNAVVGTVTGTVTLSCLGKTMAPHLTQALGVQINESQTLSSTETKEQEKRPVAAVVKDEMQEPVVCAMQETRKTEMQDSSVQCDADMIVEDNAKKLSMSSRRNDDIRLINGTARTKDSTVEGRMMSYKRDEDVAKSQLSTCRYKPRVGLDRGVDIKNGLLFQRELPPPLYFNKKAKRANTSS